MTPDDGIGLLPLPDLYRDLWPLRPLLPRTPAGLGELLPDTARRCAVCQTPCHDAYCGTPCRNLDHPHDHEGDNPDV